MALIDFVHKPSFLIRIVRSICIYMYLPIPELRPESEETLRHRYVLVNKSVLSMFCHLPAPYCSTVTVLWHTLVSGLSEGLKIWRRGGGTTSNTRSFYGAFFVSNSTKIWRRPLCPPLVPPVLPFFQRSILPKTADSINVNKL